MLRQQFAAGLILLSSAACLVTKGTYEQCTTALDATKKQLAGTQTDLDSTRTERDGLKKDRDDLSIKLTDAVGQNQQLVSKLTSMGQNVDRLLGEKDKLGKERAELAQQVDELSRLRVQAEERSADYKRLLQKLHNMIDAGTLQVKIRNGRMLVQMSSDLLFPPGGVRLKPEAQMAIESLAETLKAFPDRHFQIVGHSDSTPIATQRFPSNWELSAERAIEVVKVLVDAGVPASNLSAAGNAEFDPLVDNDSNDHKQQNRRVELVFMPKIDELPGFKDALSSAAETAVPPAPAAPPPPQK